MVEKMKGIVGENFLFLLERRFDNVVYRFGFVFLCGEVRVLVFYVYFKVNGRIVNILFYFVKVGDVIEVDERSKFKIRFVEIKEKYVKKFFLKWFDKDVENFVGKVIVFLIREDIDMLIREYLIVEFYFK